jgi:plasmid stability protein
MTKEKQKKASIYIRNLSPETKTEFKAYCAKHNMTMETAVNALIRRAIRADQAMGAIGK